MKNLLGSQRLSSRGERQRREECDQPDTCRRWQDRFPFQRASMRCWALLLDERRLGFTFSMIQFFGNNLSPYSLSDNSIILYIFIIKQMQECQICFQKNSHLYPIFHCSHQFCSDCLKAHITEKSSRFTAIICPQPDCQQALRDDFPIISQLPLQVQNRLNKYKEFLELQKNPKVKPCATVNCPGRIDMSKSKKVCSTCLLPHCPKCWKGFHQGGCVLDEHDKMMKDLHNQKCPQCNIWVEKKQGCDYINCKCGTAFCYTCGARFSEDPCRKNKIWIKEIQVRTALQELRLTISDAMSHKLSKVLSLPLKVMIIALLTILSSLIFTLAIVLFCGLLVLGSPLFVIAIICESQGFFWKLLLIIAFPVLTALLAVLLILVVLLFPIMRNTYHHGLYDGIQSLMNEGILCYLKVAKNIMNF